MSKKLKKKVQRNLERNIGRIIKKENAFSVQSGNIDEKR